MSGLRANARRLAAALLLVLDVVAAGCASSTPAWQRLRVEPGEKEQVFETVSFVISRRFPIERKDLGSGVVESRYIEERREDGLFRWQATGIVRRERLGLVVAVSTIVEEFEEAGFRMVGSVEEIDTALLAEIEDRLRVAAVGSGMRLTRLDPVETLDEGDDGASAAPREEKPPETRAPQMSRP